MDRSAADPRARRFHFILALLVLQLAIIAVVEPRGAFPLNDDWAYAESVQWLLQEHRIRLSDWIAMNLVPQTLLGGAYAALAGFSFEGLRHVGQAAACVTLVLALEWLHEAGMSWRDAAFGAVVVAAFPAWAVLSNSYMTDLFGLAWALAGATCLLRWLRGASNRWLAAGAILCAIGVLQRQVVAVVPLGTLAAMAWKDPRDVRRLLLSSLPLLLCLAVEWAFTRYLDLGPGRPAAQLVAHGRALPALFQALTDVEHARLAGARAAQIGAFLGFCLAPWALWRGVPLESRRGRFFFSGAWAALVLVAFALQWHPPYVANYVIDRFGIGPAMLYDNTRGVAPLDRSIGWFWPAVTLVAIHGLLATGVAVAAAIRRAFAAGREADPVIVLSLVVLAAYLGTFAVIDYFDRYLLFALPFLLALWNTGDGPRSRLPAHPRVALAFAAAVILLGAVATRDYFSWNRARWDAIHAAEARGATPETLDAGFEYNGFFNHERFHRQPERPGKSWWWVQDDRFVVAFSPAPGYEVVGRWPVRRLLPRTPAEVLLLERKP